MSNSNFFDTPRVSRMIAIGEPTYSVNDILPHFLPLIRQVIYKNVAFDHRNHTEDDFVQIGLLKSVDIINSFRFDQGDLFQYSLKLLKHAMWYEAKLKSLDKNRIIDEIDFDQLAKEETQDIEFDKLELNDKILQRIRTEVGSERAAQYVFGVLSANDYASNRERVLKTLTNGFDVNPKHARYLADHVLVLLRTAFTTGIKPVRDDALFKNRFQYTLVPELRGIIGERAFERLIHYFGGLTVSVPSMEAIQAIDRDLAILKALAHDWTCGPTLSKKYNISPEGIKAVYKSCLHKLHTDKQFRELVSKHISLETIPGYEDSKTRLKKVKPVVNFGEKRMAPRRKIGNTDSMGFTLGCRNSLIYTLIVTGKCSRAQLVSTVLEKFKGQEHAAKATVSAFLSDIKQEFGKFNTSRNLKIIINPQGQLSFSKESLSAAQQVIMVKRQSQMVEED